MSEYSKSCWVVTEGLIGTENQCRGLAEALNLEPVIKRVAMKAPWKQFSPWLPFTSSSLAAGSDKIDPPYPDIVIASGRKSIGAALHIKKQSGGKSFLVQVQDPRVSPKHFDLVIVPQHDPTRGDNVLVTKAAMHRVTPEKIAAAMKTFAPVLSPLPQPRVAVLIGGTSRAHRMTPDITKKLTGQLLGLVAKHNASLMVTASRRTGPENAQLLRDTLKGPNIYFWDGQGENPYFALLGYADYIVVTEDSVSMASEALSTGKPVYTAALEGGAKRLGRFHHLLREQGYTRPFTGSLEKWSYTPPHDTLTIANEIRRRLNF